MYDWQIKEKEKKYEENRQKLLKRKELERQKKLEQIEADYQESRRLTKLAEQEYKPITKTNYIPEPPKRFAIYRKVFVAKHNDLPHYNSEPRGEAMGEDIIEVDDLYMDYFYNYSLSVESNIYIKVPYKIWDRMENKEVVRITEGGLVYGD